MGDSTLQVLKGVDLVGEAPASSSRSRAAAGSGKSTLLHLLGALDAADAGSIEYDGQDIAADLRPPSGAGCATRSSASSSSSTTCCPS